MSLTASLLALAQPWITKVLIDDGLIGGDFSVVLWMCGLMFAAAVIAAGLAALNRWHYVTVSGHILFALRASVYRHLQTLSPAYFAQVRGGDLMARLDGDVAEVQRFCVDSALALINAVIVLAGAITLMLLLSWQLSLIAFCLLPLQVLLLKLLRPRIETATRSMRERASAIASFLYDTLSAMKFIQASGGQEREAGKLDQLQGNHLVQLRQLQMLNQAATALPSLLTLVGTIGVFVIGGSMVIAKTMTLGTLVAFTAYLARATGPVHTLLGLWVALKRADVSLARVHEVTGVEAAVVSPETPIELPAEAGDIAFDDVSFAYPDSDEPILQNVSVTIPAGCKTVIVGASGTGKTTLIDLLQRHFDPLDGRILVGDTDLRNLDLTGLRRRIAVVAQDTVLMSGSIADNIRYASPQAGDAEIRQAAERAGANHFIETMPDGYHSDVGSRGLKLSGGQRQRIAIARALLQDPLVLVLDEATSGVDTKTEQSIREIIDDLFAGRTRIVVAHRSALTDDADLVLELAGGALTARSGKQMQ
ncbi:MAG: ABC transporter ATP-binding protein/permease [Hyphomicrobiales bacterium]|nr:ABC transporter ATP-binding protein/permease [Hyphomicrobiales bacterium]